MNTVQCPSPEMPGYKLRSNSTKSNLIDLNCSKIMKLFFQVPLGLLFKNENKNEEMLDILQYLHDKYVPVSRNTSATGEETVKVLEKLFFGGDQLTEERARNSTDARSDGDNEYERLEGLIPKVEDWHAIRILYQVPCSSICELLFPVNKWTQPYKL